MTSRRRAREAVVQMLFQLESTEDSANTVLALYADNFADDIQLDEFIKETFLSIAHGIADVDATITKASDNWRIERMSMVDRNVIRLGVFELTSTKEIPANIVINEAVELAKKYGAEESPSFVNGVLDRVAKEEE